MIIRSWLKAIGVCVLLCLLAGSVAAQEKGVSHRIGAAKVTVVPEHFLRAYDPVTVFFPLAQGPEKGGPVDNSGSLLQIKPEQPGEYRWVDGRTLQFLPTVAWPAIERYAITVLGETREVVTLMSPPRSLQPSNGSRHLDPVAEVNIAFDSQIAPEKLAMMINFEVKPLPGAGAEEGYWLTSRDFTIKVIEHAAAEDPFQYQIVFQKPIPCGAMTTLHLRLALDDTIQGALAKYSFATKPVFALTGIGCSGRSSRDTVCPVAGKGSVYSAEQAIDCGSENSPLFLEFSDSPSSVSLNDVKRMVSFEPAVRDFRFEVSGKRILLYFDSERGRSHRISLHHVPLQTAAGRPLAEFGETSAYFFYRPPTPYLEWRAGQGIIERYGPQVFPMEGRGTGQVDLRIYKVDPFSLNFWPFSGPLSVDESVTPAGPGEEPPYASNMVEQVHQLGTPLVSKIVPLPVGGSAKARFGLNLKEYFAAVSGTDQPGAYLVGTRIIGTGSERRYVRVQVTDLCLSLVEEESAVSFVVTSIATGKPVQGAEIKVDVKINNGLKTVISGTTDASGRYRYSHTKRIEHELVRISVRKGDDTLVLDPRKSPPPLFFDNHWYNDSERLLSWLGNDPHKEKEKPVRKAHILTERPVYRPEEVVHIKGYVRLRKQGKLLLDAPNRKFNVMVNGPGDKRWTYPVTLNSYGSFYHCFDEKDLPTGEYRASIQDIDNKTLLAEVDFKKENYRVPRFEIKLSCPDSVPMDEPFKLVLTADYYAGGRVVGQQVNWQVTQLPYQHTVAEYPGFLFSSDDRFSGSSRSRKASAKQTSADVTDENGSATLKLDPTQDEDGRPRRFVIEATVRGADEQTVTATKQVLALPPFILGMKLERLITSGMSLKPQILALSHEGKPVAGRRFHLKLYQRQWHSYLQESDFTTGKAKYVTDVVDKQVFENDYTSEDAPKTIDLPVDESGVYVVELSARDKLGQTQKVQADLYVAGTTPVSWKKPKVNVFETALDKKIYEPGDTASIIMKSPFQEGQALVIVEGPAANTYHWVAVEKGQAIFRLPITGDMTPQVPVHVLLMRGRLEGTDKPLEKGAEDLGKPIAMANTTWVKVEPKAYQMNVELENPKKSMPGSEITIKIKLTDPSGKPLNGEVALWLVDRAVLSLGKEKRLDPHTSFIDEVKAMLRLRDTRNSIVGNLSLEEGPGGDGGKEEDWLFDRVSIRKLFKTVPYYNPSIEVKNGYIEVKITLPDNLTDFAIRAVATDGLERFGAAKSMVSVRLPVIVQSALPRFVRPGDKFSAGGIGRVVEGEVGPGRAELQVEGLTIDGPARLPVTWVKDKPEQLYFSLSVPQESGAEAAASVTVRMAVQRDTDKAKDAFEVKLPVQRDLDPRRLEKFVKLEPGAEVAFPAADGPVRPGTMRQSAVITAQEGVLKMLAGLSYLDGYEHWCTEQRVSKLLPELALKDLFAQIGREDRSSLMKQNMKETFTYLEQAQTSSGLFACWPGSTGYVSLTAYVVEFLLAAKSQGYEVKPALFDRAVAALKEALRSDYSRFIGGYEFVERAEALCALAEVGQYDAAYGHELLARGLSMDLYSEARVLSAFLKRDADNKKAIGRLSDDLWKSMVFKLRDGKEVYEGLQYRQQSWGGLVCASEVKTIAGMTKALYRTAPDNPHLGLLVDELVHRGEGDGWGSTNANAAALLALGEVLKTPAPSDQGMQIEATFGSGAPQVIDTKGKVVSRVTSAIAEPGKLKLVSGNAPLAWMTVEYVPAGTGDQVKQKSEGFVVDREIQEVKADGQPPEKHKSAAGQTLELAMAAIVEEHVQVINPEDRVYVAISVPFAAGFEPLNPNLATAPPEAKPAGTITLAPSYAVYGDDKVVFYYDSLPKGTYDFYFRLRSSIAGSFSHPAAKAEMMYKLATRGNSDGTRIVVKPRQGK